MASFDDISCQTHELVFVLAISDLGIFSFLGWGEHANPKKIVKTLKVFSYG